LARRLLDDHRRMVDESKSRRAILKGRWIRFKLRDICFPTLEDLIAGPAGDTMLDGQVLDISESGTEQLFYAEIVLRGSAQKVIVRIADTACRELDRTRQGAP
jgi:hypothetical protein